MELTLPPNLLFERQQVLKLHNGVATLIGGNGSGKSCILRSIFDAKLNGKDFSDTSVVCFSSGQNEAFTTLFREFLAKERSSNNALDLEGFYFDKTWSKILIFLATTIRSNGRVRQFLRERWPGNSDIRISGGFASQSWPESRIQEQQHDQKNKTEPLREFQSESGCGSVTRR